MINQIGQESGIKQYRTYLPLFTQKHDGILHVKEIKEKLQCYGSNKQRSTNCFKKIHSSLTSSQTRRWPYVIFLNRQRKIFESTANKCNYFYTKKLYSALGWTRVQKRLFRIPYSKKYRIPDPRSATLAVCEARCSGSFVQ
jgi:hypothetical protein